MSGRNVLTMLCLTAILLSAGCVTMPPEAAELSVEVGKRVSAIEDSHVRLLHAFFAEKRKQIDRFIEQEWVPAFAENVFANAKMVEYWDTIVSENNKQDRLRFVVSAGGKIQAQINSKRMELVGPLDELERRLETKIRTEYNQVRAMNNSLTGLLTSASKVAESRNRYLEMLGVTDQRMARVIDRTDAAVSNMLGKTADAADRQGGAREFVDVIMSIAESI